MVLLLYRPTRTSQLWRMLALILVVVGYGLLAISLGVRYLKVVDHQMIEVHAEEKQLAEKAKAASTTKSVKCKRL